ncbi:MAG: mucoidy inhibitor MuiA family protein [Myxococcota bacterium]
MTTTMATTQRSERLFPPVDPERRAVDCPVVKVTLLEDRAQVQRSARITVKKGHNTLRIMEVAPVLQDVSLRAESGAGGTVLDVRVRRALRILEVDKPEEARRLEAEIERLTRELRDLDEERDRLDQRHRITLEIVSKGAGEVPDDAGWGLVNPQVWHDTFESLFKKARTLREQVMHLGARHEDLTRELDRLIRERKAMDRVDHHHVAWLEVDVQAASDGEVDLSVGYVVPNALWRPWHSARLSGTGSLRFQSFAAVWQNTGEDWRDVELVFSTARSSLGTNPPTLTDDLLTAQRKSPEVVIQAREVAIQKASVPGGPAGGGGAPAMPATVDLPGVDDGGDVQNLKAPQRATVPSDGRPNLVPLSTFETPAQVSLVCMPELEPVVFLRSIQENAGRHPILAGPVELVRDSGAVGWTRVLFVAPKERFQLGFGPDDDLRVTRQVDKESEVDDVGKWNITVTQVQDFISNLGGTDKELELVERIPVSEIEHVKITLLADKTDGQPTVDDNGLVTFKVKVGAHKHERVRMFWRAAVAPGVNVPRLRG